jgi:hypothetical protein
VVQCRQGLDFSEGFHQSCGCHTCRTLDRNQVACRAMPQYVRTFD